jgi:RHS repeat-associated protein
MTGRTLAGSGSSTLTYDGENRLVTVNGPTSGAFVYDGDNGRVSGSVDGASTSYVGNYYESEQVLCSGQTPAGSTNWQVENSSIIRVDVNTSACGLGSTPLYFSSLGGAGSHWSVVGATSIYYPTATGFRVYVRLADNSALTPATANGNGWHIRWVAAPRQVRSTSVCSGQTTPGASAWQVYTADGIYLDVNTSDCGYSGVPRYITSLGGDSSHFGTTGATSIYVPTATGFRVYVRLVSGAALTPSQANSWGWRLNWLAVAVGTATPSLCGGQTGSSGWVSNGDGVYLDVNTSACGLSSTPHYLTSLGGDSGHWATTGATSIYVPTATGFRVYVRRPGVGAVTAANAQAWGWHVNWLAVSGNTTLVRKYYYAGATRVAMRENGALRWLLGDHLGSTAYTVSGTTKTGEVRYKAFGATRFTSGATPTTFRYTGQREEAGLGLYYYGARWYDPALGHFIQADTIVPEPGNVLDYHRYSYTRFNPLKYTDPTGHCAEPLTFVLCLGAAGGVSNAIGNWGGQVIKNYVSGDSFTESVRNVRYGEVGIAFGAGFVSGASAPFTGGIGGAIVVNAAIGAGQSAATQMVVDGKELTEINTGDVAVSALLGGAAGLVQGSLLTQIAPKEVAESGLYGGSKVLTELGVSADPYVKAVAPESAAVFEQMVRRAQLASTGAARTLAGVATANAPVPSIPCSKLFGCEGEPTSWAWTSIFAELDSDKK